MGTIQVPGRLSGRTYNVNIKGDTPTPSEQARIRSLVQEREDRFVQKFQSQFGEAPTPMDDGTAIGRGWELGKAGAYSRLGTSAEYLGRGLGLASLMEAGRGMRQAGDLEYFLETMRQPEPTTLEDVQAAEGILPTVGAALTYAGEGIGQSGPEMLAPLAATIGGTAVGGPLVGLGAGALTAFPSFFGGNVQRQEAEVAAGRKAEVDVTDAIIGAVGQSALNAIGDKLMLGGFLKPGQKWLTRAAIGGVEGAAAEIPTEIAQQIIERKQAGLSLDNDEAINEYVNAGILGGIMGGGVRAGTAALGIGVEKVPGPPPAPLPASRPGTASVAGVMRTKSGKSTSTAINLTDGARLVLDGDATETDIAAAVEAHNKTKAAATPAPVKPGTAVEDIPEAEVIPNEAYAAEAPAPTGGVSVDNDLADARAVYDERLAIAEEGGADPEEAKRIAAQAAVNYVDSLQADVQKRLKRFRDTMSRVSTPNLGEMQPPLPDEAYASEFGETVQKDLFAPKEEAPTATVVPVTGQRVMQVLRKAREQQAAGANQLVSKSGAQSLVDAGLLSSEDTLVPTVANAKVADLIALGPDEVSKRMRVAPEDNRQAAPEDAPKPEVSDVTETAKIESDAVGDGTSGGQSSVGDGGKPDGDILSAEGVEAPQDRRLGRNMSVPMGTDTAAGAEPASLTVLEEKLAAARSRAGELRAKVPAGVLERTLVGTKVDRTLPKKIANLQNKLNNLRASAEKARSAYNLTKVAGPAREARLKAYEDAVAKVNEAQSQLAALNNELTAAELSAGITRAAMPKVPMAGKAKQAYTNYMNALRDADTLRQQVETERARGAADQPAPAPLPTGLREPVIEDTFLTYKRGFTSKPVAPSQAVAAVAADVRKEGIMRKLVQYFMQRATPAMKRYTTARGGINNPEAWKLNPDWMSIDDQSKVTQLLGRLNRVEREKYKFTLAEVERLSPDAEAAHTYFSKTIRPVDAIDMMIADLGVDYEIYEGSLRPGIAEIEVRDLIAGTGSAVAQRALKWVRENLSDKTNAEIDLILAKEAEANAVTETWLEGDRVEERRAKRKAARKERAEAAVESGYDPISVVAKMAASDARVALQEGMHYSVKDALNAGDLKGALKALAATTTNKELAALANRFAELTGTTRVRILYPGDSAKYIGNSRGIFIQQTQVGVDPDYENIILINGQTGMTNHVLMHEMAHAVTSNLFDMQPNHPVVKQLTALLNALRKAGPSKDWYTSNGRTAVFGYSNDFYGLTNVKEMVAEAFGRSAFGETDNGLRDLMKRTKFETEPVPYAVDIPLTAWERFKEIIGNFFRTLLGRPTKYYPRRTRIEFEEGYESGLEQFNRLIDGMLEEAPQIVTTTTLERAVANPLIAKNLLNNAVLSAETWGPQGRKRLSGLMMSSVPQPLRRALLGLMQLDWFNDLAGKYFPQIATLKSLDDERRGKISAMNSSAKPVLEDLLQYAQKFPELYATLMGIQGQATIAEVDPTEPVSKYGTDQDKIRAWHDLNRQLNAADSTGEMRALFKKTRNLFKSYREEIKRVLKSRVKDITDDTAKQNQLFDQLMKKLEEENAIDPYFALMRKGDYWLEYTAEDTTGEAVNVDALGRPQRPTTRFVQAFESPFALAQFRAKLEAARGEDGKAIAWDFEENRRPISDMNREGYVPPAFVQGALNIITAFDRPNASPEERAKIDDARDAIHSMFLRLTPDHSLLKSFIKRKGTRGFIGDITPLGVIDAPVDMVQAIADKTSSLSYQLANIEYGGKIQTLINSAGKTRNDLSKSAGLTLGEKAAVDAYHDEFVERARFAKSPQVSGSAQLARGITFNMTLGFSIAGAANNLMQIPMIGATELSGRYGVGSTLRELGFAMGALRNAGKTQKVLSYGPDGREVRELSNVDNFGSIDNYFEPNENGERTLRTDMRISDEAREKIAKLDVLAEVLANNGMLSASMSQEMLEAESGWLHKINRWGGFLMHHAERFNRQTMAIAAYNLELKGAGPNPSREAKLAAAKKAIEIAERVNGTIGASTAPRFAQSAVGSVLFMFKRFGLHMARYILGTANQALRGATPEDRAVARYQIIGMLGTTALFAGVQGIPFFSEVMTLINLFFTDDEDERPEVIVQKFLGEPYYHGALNYLLGIEVASRISMSGLIFRENKIEKDQSALYDLFEMFGGPAVGVFMNTERGIQLLSEGELYRGVETMMPSAVKSIMKSFRFATEGATTLRGDEIIPLTPVDIIRQGLGYTPEAYARQQERVSGAKRIDEAVREKKRKLLRKYNLAAEDRDFAEMREILKEMREFSRKFPEDAITGDTINRSQRSFRQRSEEMISGVSFTQNGLGRAQQYISEFDEGTSIWK